MITSFLGNFGACANIRYQAAFSRPGYKAMPTQANVHRIKWPIEWPSAYLMKIVSFHSGLALLQRRQNSLIYLCIVLLTF